MHDATFASIARLAFTRSDLDKNEKLVLLALGDFVNSKSRVAYPSTETLRDMTGLSAKTIQRARIGLEAKTILKNNGQRRASRPMCK